MLGLLHINKVPKKNKFVITINIIVSGEKSNKRNQCDFPSSQAVNLKKHMKTHSGEKSNKCNQCDFASSRAGNLRTHMLYHNPEKYRYFIFKNPGIGI